MPGIDDLMRSAQEERKTKKAGVYKKSRQKREAEISKIEKADGSAEAQETASETATAPDNEVHRGAGRPRGTRTAKLTVTMEPDLRRKFKAYCAINELTASDVIGEWTEKLIRTWENEHYPL